MFFHRGRKQGKWAKRVFCGLVAWVFGVNGVLPPAIVAAQTAQAAAVNLPAPGTLLSMSAAHAPAMLQGLRVYPENPLQFNFIIDGGDENLDETSLRSEGHKLVKYFLAALTVPEKDIWVNLSPYEKDRIIPEGFSRTEMGRDVLAQDYILKQLTASLMYPENELGRRFWERVFQKAVEKYGTADIPLNTFNKVWIVPRKAAVYQNGNSVFVVESSLQVMLEEDYYALRAAMEGTASGHDFGLNKLEKQEARALSNLTTGVVRDILIPELEREVNEGETFANLRQIYQSMILAAWFKQNLKESLLGQVYVDQKKTEGIQLKDETVKERIYEQYIEALKKGVFNYIKEDTDPVTRDAIPRQYFSGGFFGDFSVTKNGLETYRRLTPEQREKIFSARNKFDLFVTLHEMTARQAWQLQEDTIDAFLSALVFNDQVPWITHQVFNGAIYAQMPKNDPVKMMADQVFLFFNQFVSQGFVEAGIFHELLTELLWQRLPLNEDTQERPQINLEQVLDQETFTAFLGGKSFIDGHASDRGIHLFKWDAPTLVHELLAFAGQSDYASTAFEVLMEEFLKTGSADFNSLLSAPRAGELAFRFQQKLGAKGVENVEIWDGHRFASFVKAVLVDAQRLLRKGRPEDLLSQMKYSKGMNTRDIASRTGLSAGAVSTLSRAGKISAPRFIEAFDDRVKENKAAVVLINPEGIKIYNEIIRAMEAERFDITESPLAALDKETVRSYLEGQQSSPDFQQRQESLLAGHALVLFLESDEAGAFERAQKAVEAIRAAHADFEEDGFHLLDVSTKQRTLAHRELFVDYFQKLNSPLTPRERAEMPEVVLANVDRGVIKTAEHLYALRILASVGAIDKLAHWAPPGEKDEKKREMLYQVIDWENSYPGGLMAYMARARNLLWDAEQGDSPLAGYSQPRTPAAVDLTDMGSQVFHQAQEEGLRAFNDTVIAVAGGGLGHRLGYGPNKMAMVTDFVTMQSFFERNARNILAMQARSNQLKGESKKVYLFHMTSEGNHQQIIDLLEKNQSFGMEGFSVLVPGEHTVNAVDGSLRVFDRHGIDQGELKQIILVAQGVVPDLRGFEGELYLNPQDEYEFAFTPHGAGDIQLLQLQTNLAKAFQAIGKKRTIFIPDVNVQEFNMMLPGLGAAIRRGFKLHLNVVKTHYGEKRGLILEVRDRNKEKKVIYVPYPLVESFLNSLNVDIHQFDWSTGNTNSFNIDQDYLVDLLDNHQGIFGEIVNPRGEPLTSRLEVLLPSIVDAARGEDVGVAVFDASFGYVPVKNDLRNAVMSAAQNILTDHIASAEGIYWRTQREKLLKGQADGSLVMDMKKKEKLALQGNYVVEVWEVTDSRGKPHREIFVAGIDGEEFPQADRAKLILRTRVKGVPYDYGAKVTWPILARPALENVRISDRSVVHFDGENISLKNVEIDGTLIIRARADQELTVRDLRVDNEGWDYADLTPEEMAAVSFRRWLAFELGNEDNVRRLYERVSAKNPAGMTGIDLNDFGAIAARELRDRSFEHEMRKKGLESFTEEFGLIPAVEDNDVKAVIFDLGNVLWRFNYRKLAREIAAFYGVGSQEQEDVILSFLEERKNRQDHPLYRLEHEKDYSMETLVGEMDQWMRSEFKNAIPIGRPAMSVEWFTDALGRISEGDIIPTMNLLQALRIKGYKIRILTTMSEFFYNWIFKSGRTEVGKLVYPEEIYPSFMTGVSKPAGEAYLRIVREMGLDARETVFIDDMAANTAGAETAGLRKGFLFNGVDISSSVREIAAYLRSSGRTREDLTRAAGPVISTLNELYQGEPKFSADEYLRGQKMVKNGELVIDLTDHLPGKYAYGREGKIVSLRNDIERVSELVRQYRQWPEEALSALNQYLLGRKTLEDAVAGISHVIGEQPARQIRAGLVAAKIALRYNLESSGMTAVVDYLMSNYSNVEDVFSSLNEDIRNRIFTIIRENAADDLSLLGDYALIDDPQIKKAIDERIRGRSGDARADELNVKLERIRQAEQAAEIRDLASNVSKRNLHIVAQRKVNYLERKVKFLAPTTREYQSKILEEALGLMNGEQVTIAALTGVAEAVQNDMIRGMKREPSSIAMLNTFLYDISEEQLGEYIAIDWGGTNLRVIKAGFNQGQEPTLKWVTHKFTLEEISGKKDAFQAVAEAIKGLGLEQGKHYSAGFTFSFPVEQSEIDAGVAAGMHGIKDWYGRHIDGKNVVQLLHNALLETGVNNVRVAVLLNDTVGTLLSVPGADAGLIFGTGLNIALVDPVTNEIINTEVGGFDTELFATDAYDQHLLRHHAPQGGHAIEKMISGKYMAELLRMKLRDRVASEALSRRLEEVGLFDAAFISKLEEVERDNIEALRGVVEKYARLSEEDARALTPADIHLAWDLAHRISLRSGRLIAAVIAGAVRYMDANITRAHIIAVDGSVYLKHPHMKKYVRDALVEIVGKDGAEKISIVPAGEGSILGAARAASLAPQMREKDAQSPPRPFVAFSKDGRPLRLGTTKIGEAVEKLLAQQITMGLVDDFSSKESKVVYKQGGELGPFIIQVNPDRHPHRRFPRPEGAVDGGCILCFMNMDARQKGFDLDTQNIIYANPRPYGKNHVEVVQKELAPEIHAEQLVHEERQVRNMVDRIERIAIREGKKAWNVTFNSKGAANVTDHFHTNDFETDNLPILTRSTVMTRKETAAVDVGFVEEYPGQVMVMQGKDKEAFIEEFYKVARNLSDTFKEGGAVEKIPYNFLLRAREEDGQAVFTGYIYSRRAETPTVQRAGLNEIKFGIMELSGVFIMYDETAAATLKEEDFEQALRDVLYQDRDYLMDHILQLSEGEKRSLEQGGQPRGEEDEVDAGGRKRESAAENIRRRRPHVLFVGFNDRKEIDTILNLHKQLNGISASNVREAYGHLQKAERDEFQLVVLKEGDERELMESYLQEFPYVMLASVPREATLKERLPEIMQAAELGKQRLVLAARREERFKSLRFGTSGLRDTDENLTDMEVYINTKGFLLSLIGSSQLLRGGHVAIAGDLRASTPRIMRAVAKACEDLGAHPLNLGFIPTPALAHYTLEQKIPGIMVTGSHIPYREGDRRNGVKFYKPSGEILKGEEARISEYMNFIRGQEYRKLADESLFDDNGAFKSEPPSLPSPVDTARKMYVARYLDTFREAFMYFLAGKTIGVYQQSSVGRDMLVEILEGLGARVVPLERSEEFVAIDTENVTDADKEHFRQMVKDIERQHGQLPFALISLDGDADRPLVMDENGEFYRGDILNLITARFLGADFAAIPDSSSTVVDMVAEQDGYELRKTDVGSPHVLQAMNDAVNLGFEMIVGWEGNGGLMTAVDFPIGENILKALPTRDALLPILAVLYTAVSEEKTVSALFENFPRRFTDTGLIDQFPIERGRALMEALSRIKQKGLEEVTFEGDAVLLKLGDRTEELLPEGARAEGDFLEERSARLRYGLALQVKGLLERHFIAADGKLNSIAALRYVTGLKIFFENGDIVHLRPSGTAPQFRAYSESDTQARASLLKEISLREPNGVIRQLEQEILGQESEVDAGGRKPEPGEELGGIDLTPLNARLQIRRDEKGAPLQLGPQAIPNLHIDGFAPAIISITPVSSFPLFLGATKEEDSQDLELSRRESLREEKMMAAVSMERTRHRWEDIMDGGD